MKGFTLIELMIVMAIIIAMAVTAIPLYNGYRERAIKAEVEQELLNLSTIEEDHFNSYRAYNTTKLDLVNFYGAVMQGANFDISIVTHATGYLATAYVCYDKPGSACTSTNKDMTCTITAGQEKPNCIE